MSEGKKEGKEERGKEGKGRSKCREKGKKKLSSSEETVKDALKGVRQIEEVKRSEQVPLAFS